ncbi:MAG TPA: serine hydrolase domain-containing protein [Caulobacteraceae bacterium]|nr:serine hydrolase domain-containing protein [Caulobacteraceae bacterium]
MSVTRRSFIGTAGAVLAVGPAAATAPDYDAARAYSEARRGVSLLVRQGGRTLFESYVHGPDRAYELASGTKSFCGVMAAALAQDGLLRLDEPCADTLAEWRDDPAKRRVTVRMLLTLTGGVGGGPVGRPPAYAEAVAAPLASEPGARFEYGPNPFQVFGEIVRRKLAAAGRGDDVYAWMTERLLGPIGIAPGFWRRREGQPVLPSGAGLTAADWARFGEFVLADGRGLVDPAALAACFQGTALNPGYGLTWWLLRPGLVEPGRRSGLAEDARAIGARADVRMAAGAGQQRLYLIPARDLVIVRQATGILDRTPAEAREWSDRAFLDLLLA